MEKERWSKEIIIRTYLAQISRVAGPKLGTAGYSTKNVHNDQRKHNAFQGEKRR